MKKGKYKLISADKLHKEWMKDPGYRREYEKLEPEFQIASAVIEARIKRGMTQSQLAKEIGTKQPSIARLEGMTSSPTISHIKKIAKVLDKKLIIRFA